MPNTHSTLNSLFTAIADAIRLKTGGSSPIVADDFPTEIANIPSGGIDPSDATATAGDILSGETAYISTGKTTGIMTNNGAVSQTLDTQTTAYTVPKGYHNGQGSVSVSTQTKSVTPTTSAQTVSADSGKVLSSVSVGAIQTQTKSVTPSTSAQTVTPDSGKYLTSVSVGAIQTQTKSATPSTSAQTITPDSGKYLTSVSVGAIPNQHSGKQGDITPSSSAQTVYVPSGWHDGSTYFDVGAIGGYVMSSLTGTLVEHISSSSSQAATKCKQGKFYVIEFVSSISLDFTSKGSLVDVFYTPSFGPSRTFMYYMNGTTQPVFKGSPIQESNVNIYEF